MWLVKPAFSTREPWAAPRMVASWMTVSLSRKHPFACDLYPLGGSTAAEMRNDQTIADIECCLVP